MKKKPSQARRRIRRKRRRLSCAEFNEFLFRKAPHFDEHILKNMLRPYLHSLRIDARLLPPKMRRAWLISEQYILSKTRISKSRRQEMDKVIDGRLRTWLASLNSNVKRIELKRRWFSDFGGRLGWVGKVETDRWDYPEPKLSQPWKKMTEKDWDKFTKDCKSK